ncbi:MAG: AMP-binding protein, partial [Proteobacteria bacterium]|nr:AMP-binding protein [Pseudomonadota bacterium]
MSDATDIIAAFAPHQRTLPTMLARQALRHGDRRLFVAGDVAWTYEETRAMAARFAGALAAVGIRTGDRVALMCSNRAEFLQVFLGCAWLGAIAVPLNTAARGLQLQHLLANSGARLLAIESHLTGALEQLDARALKLEQIWLIGGDPVSVHGWACTKLPPSGEALPPAALHPGDTVAILYTSGTTGPSKGVCCPHAQYFWWGVNTAQLLDVREGDVLCTTLPLFHTNALNSFYQAMLTGSTLAVEPRFSASR